MERLSSRLFTKQAFLFFYGAAGAYIVNIVMSAYEKVYVYIFKDWSHVLKVKRGICLLLAYLTFFYFNYLDYFHCHSRLNYKY